MKKQYKSSIIKNHKITPPPNLFFDGVPLKGYVLDFVKEIIKEHCGNIL